MPQFSLRPYQEKAILDLKDSIRRGNRRPILQLPTGAGKTVIAAEIFKMARAKGSRVIFCAPSVSLIDQTVNKFAAHGMYEVGVIQANHPMTDYSKPIQVATIQSLARRQSAFNNGIIDADIVIFDEAHIQFEFMKKWMQHEQWDDALFIGLTATPWARGMGFIFDDLIIGSTIKEMIRNKYLSDFKVFAPAHPDLGGVKTVAGDYHEGQLSQVMRDKKLVADVVDQWLKHAKDLPTIVFAVDRAHARRLQEDFQAANIECEYIDAHTDRIERNDIGKRLESGQTKVVCNVGTLIAGVDWDVRCVVHACPTKSEIKFVQSLGRGLRTAPGKDHCIFLDHADNHARLGFVTDIHYDDLDRTPKGERKKSKKLTEEKLPKECPKCKLVRPAYVHICPNCGFEPKKQSQIVSVDGELAEVNSKTRKKKVKKESFSKIQKANWFFQLCEIAKRRKYKDGWAKAQFKNKFNEWPKFQVAYMEPSSEVLNYVRHRQIKYAKGSKFKK